MMDEYGSDEAGQTSLVTALLVRALICPVGIYVSGACTA